MLTTLKEMTATIRRNLKREGIKARVSMLPVHSGNGVRVSVPAYDARFTSAEINAICFIAQCNRLTGVRGDTIDASNERLLNGKQQWNFYMPENDAA